MFDTHCHLNFSRFKKNVDSVITEAKAQGVHTIIVPGTDVKRSQKAVEVASSHEGVYAAVGIHPHHAYQYIVKSEKSKVERFIEEDLEQIEESLQDTKVLAVGEVGLDNHTYEKTKYAEYQVGDEFVRIQKDLFRAQVKLAIKYKKSLIIHNREAKRELLQILEEVWDPVLSGRTVFHCCEPDRDLYEFAKQHQIFLGVDGDITYYPEKQKFWKEITQNGTDLSQMVLETDAPFLLPEPYRSRKEFPNTPAHLPFIAGFVAEMLSIDVKLLATKSAENGAALFGL